MQKTHAILPRAALRSALNVAIKAVEKRNSIPILSNLSFVQTGSGLAIRGTDLDMQATVGIDGAAYDEEFALTLNAHTLRDLEKKAPGTDHVAIDAPVFEAYEDAPEGEESPEDKKAREARNRERSQRNFKATLDFEGLRARLDTLSPYDFPELKFDGPEKADFLVATAELKDALEATELAISTEETRYYLNGIYLHATRNRDGTGTLVRMVATDGHKLARYDLLEGAGGGIGSEWGAIIPRKTVGFLLGLVKAKGAPENVRIVVNTTKVRIQVGTVDIVSKLVDGTFPDYQRVIPAGNDKTLQIEREAFAKAIKAVSCISSERGRAFKLALKEGNACLSVSNPDAGTTEMDVPAYWPHEPMKIGFNAAYVQEILDALSGEIVTVKLGDLTGPVLLSGSDAALLYVLMPMRV